MSTVVLDITLDLPENVDTLDEIRNFIQQYNIPTYQFTPISGVGTEPFTVFRQPVINESGVLAFEGFVAPDAPPGSILTGDGQRIDRIADFERGLDITFGASFNDHGVVSFTGNTFGGSIDAPLAASGVFVGNGSFFMTVASRDTFVEEFGNFEFFGPSSINDRLDSIDVAFIGINSRFDVGVFLYEGGHISTIASSLGEFDSFNKQIPTIGGDGPFTIYAPPALDDHGTVYFTASLDNGKRGIFAGDGQQIKTIVDSKLEFDRFSAPSINNQGSVAFLAQLDNHSSGIYVRDFNGNTETIATSDGPFSEFLSDPSLNNKGDVAFQATLDNGKEGIFVGSDPVLDKVIAVGDQLGSSTVSRLLFGGREAFNGAGQLAFGAVLADGTEGIFRAQPFLTGYKVLA
ncbi:DUF7453 family protein [Leptolyngbya sp. AN03gr2]|uniref:DUF7453 family protein n=1 Tax=unclassified Leptolyngbya TaxID=2650499 RepID=UPI003D317BF4